MKALNRRLDGLVRRALPDARGTARLGPRLIYILPTQRGFLFAALLVALLVAAINYSNNLVFALTFLLAGVGVAAMLQTWRNLAGIEIEVHAPSPVFAGATAQFPVHLREPAATARLALELRLDEEAPVGLDLPRSRTASVQVPYRSRHRGRLCPQRLRIETTFPVGLFRAWSIVKPTTRGLAYPAPLEGYPRPYAVTAEGGSDGGAREGGDDFAGLRAYRQGDPLPRISWKAVARTGELHAKLFAGEERLLNRIAWDDVPASETEARLSILTAWVLDASRNGEGFSLHLPRLVKESGAGESHVEDCLSALALFGEEE